MLKNKEADKAHEHAHRRDSLDDRDVKIREFDEHNDRGDRHVHIRQPILPRLRRRRVLRDLRNLVLVCLNEKD